MKQRFFYAFGLIVLGMVAFSALSAKAIVGPPPPPPTTSNGPYYAMPSWDQQLPASTRFIVLSNWGGAAVLDRETGLVWEQSPSTVSPINWGDAQTHCNQLATGGRLGWRLPMLQELASLLDPTQTNPSLPIGNPFSNVQSNVYWSANIQADSTLGPNAWVVTFSQFVTTPFVSVSPRDSPSNFVWCVRGAQGVDAQ